jgi:hypothetical protein
MYLPSWLAFPFFWLSLLSCATPLPAADSSATIVFRESGFPAADSPEVSPERIEKLLPGARFVTADQIGPALDDPATRLLVLPYGSAFPELAWSSIHAFLQHGGNLLVLGGRPFTRAAYRDATGWHLRDYSVRFIRQLFIDQFQTTPGSDGLEFQNNPDTTFAPPRFSWQRAFSPIIRLSAVDLYNRGGSAGSIDARLDALAWGVKNGRKMSAPLLQIDHLRNGFDGSRWIFVSAELPSDFYSGSQAAELVRALVDRALQGAEEFTVRPVLPLYLPGEPVELEILWQSASKEATPLTARIRTFPEPQPSQDTEVTAVVPSPQTTILPAPKEKGFHVVEAELLQAGKIRAVYHSGFWIRDEDYLRSGPHLTVNRDFFELDGQPLAVIGTTYMSSEVQRLYFDHPNVYIWDRDLAQIHAAGLNMIRTGWWTGWDKFCDENGKPYERSLRTLEAYLMTARKYGLPVQFNFFAFLPDVLGGTNPYLDPQAVRKQQTLVSSVVGRFHDVPFLAWDLINEPSFSKRLWIMRPNDDPIELAAWNEWLSQRYPDRAALAAAWNVTPESVAGEISLPREDEFSSHGMYIGQNSLRVYDYSFFAQENFANWVHAMREKVHATGSQQLITVGQDEGGFIDRLSPAFFWPSVDFTTNHSWWQNDSLLWDSMVAKQPGVPMLIQETGLQRELNFDETARRTPEQEAALFERKVALSFVHGSGAIEWLWNSNSYMTEANESPIGALHTDGTEKPEATVMRNFAAFARSLQSHLRNPRLPSVAIITSQAAQFSALTFLQLAAQQTAVRSLGYGARQPHYVIAENQIDKLGAPTLAILPSPQALRESTWQALLNYVKNGGNLIITGSVSRDEHWHIVDRFTALHLTATTMPLTFHSASLSFEENPRQPKTPSISAEFDQQKQFMLEFLKFEDGATVKELSLGKGKIFWAAFPLELAEGSLPAAAFYNAVLRRIGLEPPFTSDSWLPQSILIYPIDLQDSVLYVLESESDVDAQVKLHDPSTNVDLQLSLPAQHAALALIGKKEKTILAKYGF